MTAFNADDIDRTALIGAHGHTFPTLAAAIDAHRATGIVICTDSSTCCDRSGQAALLTAVTTATRAFGTVIAVVEDPLPTVLGGPHRGDRLCDAITGEGAVLATGDDIVPENWPVVLVGPSSPTPPNLMRESRPVRAVLRSSWSGWTASVCPGSAPVSPSVVPCILGAILAGALAIHEAFGSVLNRPGSDAGHRLVHLNLWRPGCDTDDHGVSLCHAPAAWWLVGLGHLGQAYALVVSWLPYVDPMKVPVTLQDTDHVTPSTHSTGVLTDTATVGARKTRVVDAALHAAGFDPAIIDRRFNNDSAISAEDYHVALLGVDNLATRRLTSNAGWRLAIDAGLGSGPRNFSSLVIRRFPGAVRSASVAAWQNEPAEVTIPDSPAFQDLHRRDTCGAVQLAGKAVGASFVGVITACHAVAEATRELHGGNGLDVLAADLATTDLRVAAAATPVDVLSLPLMVT